MKPRAVFFGLTFSLIVSFNWNQRLHANPQLQREAGLSPGSEQVRSTTTLSQADLKFGTKQLIKLIADRPLMKGYASPGDPVWTSAVRGFAGETCEHHVSWNSEDLDDKPLSYASDHEWPSAPNFKSFIRIRANGPDGSPYSGEFLWSSLFYELFNLANYKEFDAAYDQALTGSVSKAEWITITTKLEYLAMQKSITFYKDVWLPQMNARGMTSIGEDWQPGFQENYEKWIAQYWDPNSYPNDYWGRYYDDSITPYVEATKEWEQQQMVPLFQK